MVANYATPPIIVVDDDDPFILSQLISSLEQARYQVLEATDGNQALDLYRCYHPDLMLLNADLPGISGLACCRFIRFLRAAAVQVAQAKLPSRPEHQLAFTTQVMIFPIVLTLPYGDPDLARLALAAGASGYVPKPLDMPALQQQLKACFTRAQALDLNTA
jgi:DNA-binding response OmpR family regulator